MWKKKSIKTKKFVWQGYREVNKKISKDTLSRFPKELLKGYVCDIFKFYKIFREKRQFLESFFYKRKFKEKTNKIIFDLVDLYVLRNWLKRGGLGRFWLFIVVSVFVYIGYSTLRKDFQSFWSIAFLFINWFWPVLTSNCCNIGQI